PGATPRRPHRQVHRARVPVEPQRRGIRDPGRVPRPPQVRWFAAGPPQTQREELAVLAPGRHARERTRADRRRGSRTILGGSPPPPKAPTGAPPPPARA